MRGRCHPPRVLDIMAPCTQMAAESWLFENDCALRIRQFDNRLVKIDSESRATLTIVAFQPNSRTDICYSQVRFSLIFPLLVEEDAGSSFVDPQSQPRLAILATKCDVRSGRVSLKVHDELTSRV